MRPHDLLDLKAWREEDVAVAGNSGHASTRASAPGRPSILARLLAALHKSRERDSARAIARHWHLVEEARAYEPRHRDEPMARRGLPLGASLNPFNERSASCRFR